MSERVLETGPSLRSIVTRNTLLPPPDRREDPRWSESWEHLFRTYQPAMVRYVRGILARHGAEPGEADELVSDYLAQSMEKGWLAPSEAEVRCFRAWLQTQLKRFAYKHLRRRNAKLAIEGAELASEPDADASALDEGWVAVGLERALEALRRGNSLYAAVIEDLLATDGSGSPDLGERLDRRHEQLVHLRHRARRRFALLFHEELRKTVRDEEAFEELCARLEPLLP